MTRDIIVIGASAGGVEALANLVRALPEDLEAAVFVVLHIMPHSASTLPAILSRAGKLPARHAMDGEVFRHGHIYVAPPDHHLLIVGDRIRLTRGPSENGHRPAVDPLFRTAAREHGANVVGVILSGTLDDGASGLLAVKRGRGLTIVQDPHEALFDGMPNSAIESVAVDYVSPITEIADLIVRAASSKPAGESYPPGDESLVPAVPDAIPSPAPGKLAVAAPKKDVFVTRGANNNAATATAVRDDEALHEETLTDDIAAVSMDNPEALDSESRPGEPSVYSCPACGGVLWELDDKQVLRFRCRTGHAYSSDSLLAEQVDAIGAALWSSLRALEEAASLAHRLSERATLRGHRLTAQRFADQASENDERARIIRNALDKGLI